MVIYSIYRFTNLINGKVYIGKTVGPAKSRESRHIRSSKGSSKLAIHRAIRKHGIENFKFDVIFNCFLREDLDHFERKFIEEHHSFIHDAGSNGYNMTRGGDGGSTATSAKLRENALKQVAEGTHPLAGKRGSDFQRQRVIDGTHNNFGETASVATTKKNNERVLNGTHPWTGEVGSVASSNRQKQRIADGTHPWAGDAAKARIAELLEKGEHCSQVVHHCPICGRSGGGNRWKGLHFTKCQSNQPMVT